MKELRKYRETLKDWGLQKEEFHTLTSLDSLLHKLEMPLVT